LANLAAARQFEKILRAPDVHLLVRQRVLNRWSHSRSRCKMHDDVSWWAKFRLQLVEIAKVGFHHPPSSVLPMFPDVLFFERTAIETVEIVQDSHVMTVSEERINDIAPNESGASRYQYVHAG
jgi:hypothetical protein